MDDWGLAARLATEGCFYLEDAAYVSGGYCVRIDGLDVGGFAIA